MSANIKDVAKQANVSTATVSNVITGKKYVSPNLKKKVNKAIEELSYRPSRLARNLKIRKTFQIGLMIPDITNPYFAEIARGVEEEALKNDYQLFLCNTDGEAKREEDTTKLFLDHRVDGIISVAPRLSEEKINFYSNNVPTVIVDRHLISKNPYIDIIYTNNYKGSYMLADHLVSKMHKKFFCLAGPKNVHSSRRRLLGFVERINKEKKLKIEVKYGRFKFEDGYDLMNQQLKSNFVPTAVFAGNDMMAWGALEAIKERKIKIPDEIAIAGFDNIYFCKYLVPSLTTVHQPKYEAGLIGIRTLLKKIDLIKSKKKILSENLELEPELIIREST